MSRFEVTHLNIRIAGDQPFTMDSHTHGTTAVVTRKHVLSRVLSIQLGSLLTYAHSHKAVRELADIWEDAAELGRRFLPAVVNPNNPAVAYDHAEIGVVLRLADYTPADKIGTQGIGAGASPDGHAHLVVRTGPLVVRAYDMAAVMSWADSWHTAEHAATALWEVPPSDPSEIHERNVRARIARTGQLPPPGR